MICKALHNFIEKCTVILGWCYTSTEVELTKQKQKVLSEEALVKMFPEFDLVQCFKNLDSNSLEESGLTGIDQNSAAAKLQEEERRSESRRRPGSVANNGNKLGALSALLLVTLLSSILWRNACSNCVIK